MSAWRSLPDELDPDVRTFTERLRLLVERSGLGVDAVADRAGGGRADWDAYLNAQRPVPRAAVVALADATGADLGSLTAHWEHADRAWKRPPQPPEPEPGTGAGAGAELDAGAEPVRGPAAVRAPEDVRDRPRAPEGVPAAERTLRIRKVVPPTPAPAPSPTPAPISAPTPAPGRRRRGSPLLYAAGVLGAGLVVTAAVLLADLGGSAAPPAAAPPPPATTTAPPPPSALPDGVRCTGADCDGRDPERMGCGGPHATTVARVRVGTALVEVRHSSACAAAWARITGAAAGDEVTVQAGTAVQVERVPGNGDTDAYTAMVPVPSGSGVRACATRSDGAEGCTGE
ncbi:helix-turn-helix domain-containing protein [Streptomyces filamentosus]|uniref:helix-turn-helix domain-containing protein n=1 Tax=Streptomyces filamentosus TaxID=67294 RepID=UPI0012384C1F|nr:XRE family transcriptional regulator [Streptomyces filamentosus]KAA6219260.1 XRE family transcriptional regulator [Streptomyces filamentosus]